MKRPASVLKRPASSRVISKGKPAKAAASSLDVLLKLHKKSKLRFDPVVADGPHVANGLLFVENAFIARQTARGDSHVQQQPLFCLQCFMPVGPLESALALATNRITRAELLEYARCNEGDAPGLLRWLDFASKTAALPSTSKSGTSSSPVIFSAIPQVCVDSSPCFCSDSCRKSWTKALHPLRIEDLLASNIKSSEHTDVLVMAAEAVAQACWPDGVPLPHDIACANLHCILCVQDDSSDDIPVSVARKAYSLLIKSLDTQFRTPAKRSLPMDVYCRILSSLNLRSWGLNGMNLPSVLGQYCEKMCDDHVCEAARADMCSALGPVVNTLTEQLDMLDSDAEDEGPAELDVNIPENRGKVPLMAAEQATLTKPIVIKQLFSESDIQLIKRVSHDVSTSEHNKHEVGTQWRTRYLHAHGALRREAPALLEKLFKAALQADSGSDGWGLLRDCADLSGIRPRVVEHHIVSSGGSLPDPTHFDGGSILTIDIMLNDPESDFTGGEFCTVEHDGTSTHHSFGKGDALVFVSHKPHFVRPVKSGIRETLIMELWEGVERACDHRCPQNFGECPVEAGGSKASAMLGAADVGRTESLRSIIERDASRAFAATAFEGIAFFTKIAKIMSQSDVLRKSVPNVKPNVEITFENCGVVASVRALAKIRRGDVLVAACYDASGESLVETSDGEMSCESGDHSS